MDKWEYEITSYPMKEVMEEVEKEASVIYCDPEGICLHKDMPTANREVITKLFNSRGSLGWELIETHYNNNSRELICLWKKKKPFQQLEH